MMNKPNMFIVKGDRVQPLGEADELKFEEAVEFEATLKETEHQLTLAGMVSANDMVTAIFPGGIIPKLLAFGRQRQVPVVLNIEVLP